MTSPFKSLSPISPVLAFSVYVFIMGGFFMYQHNSLSNVIAGSLFGASVGVGEFKIATIPLINKYVAISGAIFMFLSSLILGFNSVDDSTTWYIFGVAASVSIFWVHLNEN